MGGVCHGSDPTGPVECGNSQHSPPTSLEHDIGPLRVAGLQGIPVPQVAMGDWHRMCDELVEQDLMTDTAADLPLASGIRRKRPDGWAGRRMLRILEFTRCNDYRQDWRETTERYKTRRYQPLRDKMAELLPRGWSVEVVKLDKI